MSALTGKCQLSLEAIVLTANLGNVDIFCQMCIHFTFAWMKSSIPNINAQQRFYYECVRMSGHCLEEAHDTERGS